MNSKPKVSFSTVLFYLSMGTVIVWLILKVTGVINTPVWLEYGVPLGGFITAFLTFYRDIFKEIRAVGSDITTLRIDVGSLKTDVSTLKNRTDHIERKLDHVDKKVDALER